MNVALLLVPPLQTSKVLLDQGLAAQSTSVLLRGSVQQILRALKPASLSRYERRESFLFLVVIGYPKLTSERM